MEIHRQGDVVIESHEAVPPDATPIQFDGVLARGEATGHAHRLLNVERVHFFRGRDEALWFTVEPGGGPLVHEEHGPHSFVPGRAYRVHIQREYEPDGWRRVTD